VRKVAFAILVLALSAVAAAQTFEVASIKAAGQLDPQKLLSGQQRIGMKVSQDRVDIEMTSLTELVQMAFKGIRPAQISGPGWPTPGSDPLAVLNATRFDIHAKISAGATEEQVPAMLQALLVDRFKLAFHRDSKEQNVYALVVGKDGPKLEPSPPDEPAAETSKVARPDAIQVSGTPQTGMTVKAATGAMRMQMGQDGVMHITSEKATMEQVAASLDRFVNRPVIDQTGVQGTFKMTFDIPMADLLAAARASGINVPAPGGGGAFGGGAAPAAGPSDPVGGSSTSILKSVEKMGLKLEPRKAFVESLVIDHLEKMPTDD
jgi:uncharacterized protein (TIGR03435 family)